MSTTSAHPPSPPPPTTMPTTPLWPWLVWSGVVLGLDQLTKMLILMNYQWGEGTVVTSFFNIVRVHNTGAAFSFLADAGGWQRWFFTVVGMVAVVFMGWMLKNHRDQKLFALAMSSLLGGAIGNVIDRVLYGYVVDFLDFHWTWLDGLFHRGHFPAFNLADSAITLGVICLILDELLRMKRGDKK